ncbi:glycosyl hydrolase 115 family protein [Butyrivibrio sp. YAB3001]|uniref:glycosyl hydrolase 115 family protein n=1 Tax=Butyrivibrio sp. YAB3001 TaxID=1520812 RepID=UPI0008F627F3|nr:glycosyl hydrolase 115 family protein [Butyrivibrio sp. YAB3001]SFC47479.1 Glycosyl hydrolase family 115 [Butyrivibrio sp. YAB3001]
MSTKDKSNLITSNTYIADKNNFSKAVQYAITSLERDIANTCTKSDNKGICISLKKEPYVEAQCFEIRLKGVDNCEEKGQCLEISASDDFGFIYGIYHVSKVFLGVNEFWFWNEQNFVKKDVYEVDDNYHFASKPFPVRFRGWFVNDEVLIDSWNPNGDTLLPWRMAFEALLRCGGNMVIPGTDENAHIYNQLASDMGLWITHHHAEPLGAQMFARAYPDLEASYDKYPELFEKLWIDAIEKQKNYKVIWNLGFRGQGDRPFWLDDPTYDTDEKRGALISRLIRKQYNLVKSYDENAIFCSNLYGEIMELYKKGFIDLPDDIIFIWADNGFGKMVSRRQGNHNPRVYALPEAGTKGRHGIYYHASFYDLQAAAQMTMLPNSPEFVVKELLNVYEKNADDFWIINCSNIKPHAYYLNLIANCWKDENGKLSELRHVADGCTANLDNEIEQFTLNIRKDYCDRYFGSSHSEEVAELYRLWPKFCPSYGPNEDDHAGEQFANHGARSLITAFITGFNKNNPVITASADEWRWFSDKKTLKEQIDDYLNVIEGAVNGYEEYLNKCQMVKDMLTDDKKHLLEKLLIWQVNYHYYGYLGALHACKAMTYCLTDTKMQEDELNPLDNSTSGSPVFLKAFFEAGLAAKAFQEGYTKMRATENGIFEGFFENDCEADIRQSYYVAKGLMSYLRFQGDGPHFYKWQRMFQQEAGGNKVHLILRIKKHLTDEELWELMMDKE